jgi:hypothetical protein
MASPSVIYSDNDVFGIQRVRKINGLECYEITPPSSETTFHIFVEPSTIYIGIKHANVMHICNIQQSNIFSQELQDFISTNTASISVYLVTGDYNTHNSINDEAVKSKIPFVLIDQTIPDKTPVPLELANIQIDKLNRQLEKNNPSKRLVLNYITMYPDNSTVPLLNSYSYNMQLNTYVRPQLMLCLFEGETECVSSLLFRYYLDYIPPTVYIDFTTKQGYERRNYNKLLISVAIIVSEFLFSTEYLPLIICHAVNPVSSITMIRHFNALLVRQPSTHDSQLEVYDELDKERLIKIVETKHRQNSVSETILDLTVENVANAQRVFNVTVQGMNGGRRYKKTTRRMNKKRKYRKTKRVV